MILRPFKKIREQEEKIDKLLEEIMSYKQKEQDRKSGKHKTGIWCNDCKNLLEKVQYNPVSCEYVYRFCKLDCECEDRSEE